MVSTGRCYCPYISQVNQVIKKMFWRTHYFNKSMLLPLRSPESSPLHFYLWGAEKSAVYEMNPPILDGSQAAIKTFILSISSEQLISVFGNRLKRVQLRINANGNHIQRLLQFSFIFNINKCKCK